jgi:hypothetical protein
MPIWGKIHKKQVGGQPIMASTLRQLADTCDTVSRLTADPPLEIVNTGGGMMLRLAGMLFSVYIVTANGTITARVGTTPGTGNATIQTWNGTALASLGVDKKVYSISSTTGGIPTGTWGIMLRICGSYWFITLDCGN